MERRVEILIREAYEFGDELSRRYWTRLLTFPAPASIAIVKEFYANAPHFSDREEPFISYVRGRRVPFDAVTINSFLNTQWPEGTVSCEYVAAREAEFRGIDFEDMERVLCVPGGHFQRNRQGQPLHVRRSFLTPMCKYWVVFIHANISPCSHVSDLNTGRAEISNCAHSANPKAPLGHPSLITHLCEIVRVDTSTPPFERPRKTIGRAYYTQYCLLDEEGLPIPTPQPLQPHRRHMPLPHGRRQPAQPDQPAQQDLFQMFDMRLALLDAKLEAIHKIGLAQAEIMRQVYAASHLDFMTSGPGPFEWGDGTSSGAQEMEEDETNEEEEAETEVDDDEEGNDDDEEDDSDDNENGLSLGWLRLQEKNEKKSEKKKSKKKKKKEQDQEKESIDEKFQRELRIGCNCLKYKRGVNVFIVVETKDKVELCDHVMLERASKLSRVRSQGRATKARSEEVSLQTPPQRGVGRPSARISSQIVAPGSL
ncbi:hypothetical protein V8G54_010682 [Vigna mungo]|uniref:Putative plant transposon protein domain-containing protein n=1 Tax=Vigna mungo TaxID=3915 RepID=A0AAQ3NWZ9_VIGMU